MPIVGNARTYRFKRFVFGVVADVTGVVTDDAAFAQIRNHTITLRPNRSGNWEVSGAHFDIMTRPGYYPQRRKGIKIYYILKKKNRNEFVYVIPEGRTSYISVNYTSDDAWWHTLVSTPNPPIPRFDTGVPTNGDDDPAEAFDTIRWNLSATVGWVTP